MERDLLSLLDDFNSGKRSAFGKPKFYNIFGVECLSNDSYWMNEYIFCKSCCYFCDIAYFTWILTWYNVCNLGEVCTTEQMEGIRDQQESLARLHFELSAKQDIPDAMSDDGKTLSLWWICN